MLSEILFVILVVMMLVVVLFGVRILYVSWVSLLRVVFGVMVVSLVEWMVMRVKMNMSGMVRIFIIMLMLKKRCLVIIIVVFMIGMLIWNIFIGSLMLVRLLIGFVCWLFVSRLVSDCMMGFGLLVKVYSDEVVMRVVVFYSD